MKISIVTANLNGNRFLAESIGSVLSQSHRDLELLIVDGGSTDGSLETIKTTALLDNRVSWISEPDRGIADAMNKGIRMATGGVIGVLHSDDCYSDTMILATVAARMSKHPQACWITGGVDFINSAGVIFKNIPVRDYSYQRLVRSNILFHPATFVRAEVFRDCGMFNAELKLAMDYDLWLRIGELGDPIQVNRSLAYFRVHDASLSIQGADEALYEEFSIRKRYLSEKGRRVWPYFFHHQVKRLVNAFFVRGLRRASV